MTTNGQATSPATANVHSSVHRLRLLFIRATIIILTLAVALLLWRPWGKWDANLERASCNGHLLVVRFYLWRGENVNRRGERGATPLMVAAWNGHLKVVELLVRRGAAIDAVDDSGNTALSWAASRGQKDVVAYLISKGAALDRQDVEGNTAILYAMGNRQPSTARLLLNAGADVNLENKKGETVLQAAEQGGYDGMVALLKRHGAINRNVSIGPSQYPSAKLSPQHLWALATTALLVQYNGDSHELLGSRPASDHAWAQIGLRKWWGITSREQAVETLDWLEKIGHRHSYQTEDRSRKREHQPPIPYLAWDYCRLVWVAGVSYVAGYLSEEEAWQRIMPAARAIQANYSSWREMGEDYLRGRQRWNGRHDPQFDHIFQLLTNPDDPTSPWNKNAWNTNLSGKDRMNRDR